MKIYGISVVKNEEDVIRDSLTIASEWCEKIFVLDNGSEDGTWKEIMDVAKGNDKIIPWKQMNVAFYEGLRAEVFNEFRHIAEEGDWWCFRLDADEFYIDDPRDFLPRVPSNRHYVCRESVEYYLTFEDLEEYEFEGRFPEDRNKIRYYRPESHTEARFFRHRDRLKWDPQDPFPRHMGVVYEKRIMCKHYQYRSVDQMKTRLLTRQKARTDGFVGWDHASQESYTELLMHRSELIYDNQDGSYHITHCKNDHLHKPIVFLAKSFLHGTGILP